MRTWLFPAAAKPLPQEDEEEVDGGHGTTTPTSSPPCTKNVDVDVGAAAAAAAPTTTWMSMLQLSSVARHGRVGLVVAGLVFLALLVGTSWIDLETASSFLLGTGTRQQQLQQHRRRPPHHSPSSPATLLPIILSCGNHTTPQRPTCRTGRRAPSMAPSSSPAAAQSVPPPSSTSTAAPPPQCPDYFRYIHSDLKPWRASGLTREAVERGMPKAAFRLVVVAGRAYVETYHRVFQTRDTFTQWGIAQLLARYPGRVPDLDLMFNCEDMPEVPAAAYPGADHSAAPPLFRYCKDASTLDILFPDWSFWGWPEVNVRPWAPLLAEMAAESARLPWPDRLPYAHWKGNPGVSRLRGDLLRCNASGDSKVRAFRQDWGAAGRNGFRDSNPARQCAYRYKVYVQGRSWSVSRKYILACDSPSLSVSTTFQDFFSRGLVAGEHYWPISPAPPERMCRDIGFAVRWGDAHPARAARMGRDGAAFARDDMGMDYVYDYMLHVLTQYASLLRYKPTVPEGAVELCLESMACAESGRVRDFMMQSMERYVADYEPCTLPPPLSEEEAREVARREQEVRAKIDKMMTTEKKS